MNRPRNLKDFLQWSRDKILAKYANVEFCDIKLHEPLEHKRWTSKKRYCHYHRSIGHDTNKCNALKDDIEELILKRKLGQYVRKDYERPCSWSLRKGKVVVNRVEGGETPKTMKKGWKAIVGSTSTTKINSNQPSMTFEDKDLLNGNPNKYILLIFGELWSKRILVDQGSSTNIMFIGLLAKLGISEEDHTLIED